MSATQRGAIIFAIIIAVLVVCYQATFFWLPNSGSAMALPVIVVPGEPYLEGWNPFGIPNFNWTNTLTATILTDLMVLIFVALAWRASNGWTRKVPTRFQALAEMIGEFIYNQSKNIAGANAGLVFPLVATIFVFLLAMNWMKLLPGVESVGIMHCAGHNSVETGINVTSGHPKVGDRLLVSQALFGGYEADEEDYHACEAYKEGHVATPALDDLNTAADALALEETHLSEELAAGNLTQEEYDAELAEVRLHATESVWPHASVGFSSAVLRDPNAVPYLFVVTPYVRGGSTDLNLTFGLALISMVAVQIFGVIVQGPNYFQKFVNLRALGNANKKPMGLMDFGVGLFEIVSELAKIISLSFRLFGNLFAGGILLAVMSFLVSFLLPMVFVGLELVVTTIQAYVFAVLTLVFAAQAMEGHHGDDEEHGHGEEAAAH